MFGFVFGDVHRASDDCVVEWVCSSGVDFCAEDSRGKKERRRSARSGRRFGNEKKKTKKSANVDEEMAVEKILLGPRIHRARFGVIHLPNHANRHGYVQFVHLLHLRQKTTKQCLWYVSILLQRRRAVRRVCVFLLPQQIFRRKEATTTRRRKSSSSFSSWKKRRVTIIIIIIIVKICKRSNPTKTTPPPNASIENERLPPRRRRRRRLPARATVRALPPASN